MANKKKKAEKIPPLPLDKNGNPKDPLDDIKYPKVDNPSPYKDPLDDVK